MAPSSFTNSMLPVVKSAGASAADREPVLLGFALLPVPATAAAEAPESRRKATSPEAPSSRTNAAGAAAFGADLDPAPLRAPRSIATPASAAPAEKATAAPPLLPAPPPPLAPASGALGTLGVFVPKRRFRKLPWSLDPSAAASPSLPLGAASSSPPSPSKIYTQTHIIITALYEIKVEAGDLEGIIAGSTLNTMPPKNVARALFEMGSELCKRI